MSYETVTVDEAIAKGHRMVTIPGVAILVGLIGLTIYFGVNKMIPSWGYAAGAAIAVIAAWLHWSINVPKWKIWAFENVRNVHELKKRAIQEQLIWSDKNIFRKTEILSAEQKEKWEALQDKFKQEDEFIDDPSVPTETIIYFSKAKNFFEMAIMLLGVALGVYLMGFTDRAIIGIFMVVIFGFLTYREYREATNTEAQIILNEKGIQTCEVPFCEWSTIQNEEAVIIRSGKTSHSFLVYNHPGGSVQLQIDDYNIEVKPLNKLLVLYRGRYELKRKAY